MVVTKKGSLLKRRDVFKTYRPRLFVLDPPLLHYYLTPQDVAPRKSIFLTGCKVKEDQDGQFLIMSSEGEAAYYLQCHDARTRADWIEALTAAAEPTPPTPR